MPLGLRLRKLQDIKDEVVYELKERDLTYEELAYVFNMTKQGVHKAVKRYKSKLLKEQWTNG